MISKATHFAEKCKDEDKHANNGTREPFQKLHSFLWHLLILNVWHFSAQIPRRPVLEENKALGYYCSIKYFMHTQIYTHTHLYMMNKRQQKVNNYFSKTNNIWENYIKDAQLNKCECVKITYKHINFIYILIMLTEIST